MKQLVNRVGVFLFSALLIMLTTTVIAQPNVSFSTTPTCVGEVVSFSNTSSANGSPLASYSWDFGDGEGSSVRNPVHTFTTPGTKNVTLTVIDDNGDRAEVTNSVTIYPKASTAFNITTTDRCVGVTQSFSNTSSISSGTYSSSWTFGDGGSSTANNPSYTYSTPGTYTVTLTTSSNNSCTETASRQITIYPEPTADFTFSGDVCLGEAISFTNNSAIESGNLTYSWDFDDLSTSTEINPQHTFSTVGAYDVALTVTSEDGSCEDVVTKTVNVYAKPSVNFTFSDICLDGTATFTNTSSITAGTMTYDWSFGDGNTSTATSPTHSFSNPGSYTVQLTATSNNGCIEVISKEINVYPLPESTFESVAEVCLGDAVSFTSNATVTSGSLSHAWNFGDGNNSTATNPSHTFLSAGLYTVQLTVQSDFNCTDSYSKQIRVFPVSAGGSVSGATTRCADDNAAYTLTLSGHTGDVIRWERSLTGTDQWISIDETSTTLTYSDLQETTWFRAVVKSGVCDEEPSASSRIQIDELSEGGEITGSAEVCSGTNSTELEVTGYTGTILDWEQSSSASGPWTSVGVTNTTYTATNLTATTYYRAEVQNGVCGSDYSSIATVTVIPETVGGSVSGATTRCADDNAAYTLTLSGHTGDVIRWERSLTGTDQWISIDETSTTLTYSDLQETTWFRAVVKSGVCDEEASASSRIQIDELSEGGEITGSAEVCSGTNSTELEVTGYTGTILDWEQSSSASGPWTSVGVTNTTYTATNLTATTYYRAEVQNGVCGSDYSSIATVTVIPETVGGSVSGATTRCADDNAAYTLTLSGHTGDVIRWERSLTGTDQWISIDETSTTLTYSDLQETTWFRAVVKSGVCDEEPSASSRIQIDELSEGGEITGSAEVCRGTNSTELEVTGYTGTILDWEQSSSASGPWTSVGVTNTTYTATNLTATTYYRAEVQNGVCGSDYSSIATVTVIPETVGGSVSGATTRCADDNAAYTLTLSGHTGDVIRWERSLTGTDQWISIDETSTTLTYSDLQETTWFRAVVKSGVCDEEASASSRIQIDELSEGGEITGSAEVCSGTNSTELEVTGYTGTILDWEQSSSASGPWTSVGVTNTTYTATNLTATTYYRAEVQNGVCGSDYSSVATVTVIPETDAGILSGNSTQCQGDNNGQISLTGHVGNIQRWEYSLTGEQPWTPINNTTSTLDYDNLDQSTWYRVVVKSGVCDEQISNVVEITIDTPTEAGSITGIEEVCSDLNSGTLTLVDYNGAIVKWQQSVDQSTWTDISNTTAQQSFNNLTSSRYYRVQVKNGECTLETTQAHLVTVYSLPNVAFTAAEVCETARTNFVNTSSVTSGSVDGFEWNFADGESSTLANPTHIYDSYGTYAVKLIVESTKGCIDSLTRDVTVNPNPAADFSQDNVCLEEGMDFSDLSTVALGSITTYSWDMGDGNTQSDADFSYVYDDYGSFDVTLEVETNKGCTNEVTRQIEIYPLPNTSFSGTDVCLGESTSFANNSSIVDGSITYTWDFGDGNTAIAINPTHQYDAAGTYNVNLVATSAKGCDTDTTVTVQVFEQPTADFTFENICLNEVAAFTNTSTGSELSYTWAFGDGTSSTEQSPTHSYEGPGLYQVELSIENPNGCNSFKRQVIRVSPMPVVSFEMRDVCLEETVNYSNYSTITSGSMTYEWSFGDGNASTVMEPSHSYQNDGTYLVSLTASSNYGCVVEESKNVTVHPLPEPDFMAESVCDGALTYFQDESAINTGTISEYLWDFGDQTNSILANPQKQYLNPGTYEVTLRLTSDQNCKADTAKEVVVHDFPIANFSVENVCFGFAIQPENQSEIASGTMTYLWDFGDGNTATSRNPSHLYQEPGIYEVTLTATSGNNCADVITREVEMYPIPEVSAGQDTSVSKGYSVQLQAEGGVRYSWFPLDGLNNSNVSNPIATPLSSTNYEVTVTNEFGCRNKDTVFVNVMEDFRLVANNVFTPDDNGQNDTWVIQNVETFGDVNVRVYDRYGALVYQSKAYQNDWSGTYGNDILPDGTYFYVITFSESDQKYNGALTIIRNR
ncbi:PKD domain-containing protein [Marinoscillum sp.]|uniref:PKD domain-containing protein n=1 Tax=Marinoscillum sp. TaxID=2024838 RepID=UPI003BAA5ACB